MIEFGCVRPVGAHLVERARTQGAQIAFADAASELSYTELEQRTLAVATALMDLDIAAGTSVAVFLPNSVRWIEAALAIVRRGAVMVPISYESSEEEVLYRLGDAGCAAVISLAEKREMLERLAAKLPGLGRLLLAGLEPGARRDRLCSYEALRETPPRQEAAGGEDLEAPAFILYTSGTTGRAKGVVLNQRSLMWDIAAAWIPIAGLSARDRMLAPLPLFHSYALDLVVLGTLAAGATTRVMSRFSTEEALRLLGGGGFTLFPGVPTMFHYLLERAPEGPIRLPDLRLCISAGAIMPAMLNAAFERRTGVTLVDGYGITETATMVTMNWPGKPRVMGSCGIPIPGQQVRIVDPLARRDVAPGAEGELVVRGPNLMLRYHGKPEETARALVDGWYLTGDLARADGNGFITITGRLKEIIIRGGQNIAPAEIEEVVAQFPGVLDNAVVAGKHAALGEVPVLFVVPKPGARLDEAALRAFCRQHLSAYKVPDSIHVIDRIPRTGSGKIQRFELQKLLA
ncbi:MAG TPA: AMP-binding protein [Stellaceae bacterium]|nr:AMP-binding protein [Stellaceae bacterium]